jgi:hypothetical protein
MVPPDRPLADCVADLRAKIGAVPLDNNDILLLALDEISRTITHEELAYSTGKPCAT